MKQFENKVLFIKDEAMLDEVKKLILDFRFNLDREKFCLLGKSVDYLYLNPHNNIFSLSFKDERDQEINFEQFKELLKQK